MYWCIYIYLIIPGRPLLPEIWVAIYYAVYFVHIFVLQLSFRLAVALSMSSPNLQQPEQPLENTQNKFNTIHQDRRWIWY